jgi:hypothetical protein
MHRRVAVASPPRLRHVLALAVRSAHARCLAVALSLLWRLLLLLPPSPSPSSSCRALDIVTSDDAASVNLGRPRRIHCCLPLAIKFYSNRLSSSRIGRLRRRHVGVWNAQKPPETGATGCASPASFKHAYPRYANNSKRKLTLAHAAPTALSPSMHGTLASNYLSCPSCPCTLYRRYRRRRILVGPVQLCCYGCRVLLPGRYSATWCMTHDCFRPTKRHVSSCNPVNASALCFSRLVSGSKTSMSYLQSYPVGVRLV